jgi:hypothetical protein
VTVSCEISAGSSVGCRLYVSFAAADAKARLSKKSRVSAPHVAVDSTVQPKFNASCSNIDIPAQSWALLSSPCTWNNCGVYCTDGTPASLESLSLPFIHGVDGAQRSPAARAASSRFCSPGAALAFVDMCLLWNSTRFVLEPEGKGNCMPPLQLVFVGHDSAAAAAAASCAAFTHWACASIGTTIHTHTLLTGSCPPLPISLRNYLHANGVSNLCLRLADVPPKSAAQSSPITANSTVEVDAATFRARSLPASATGDGHVRTGSKGSGGLSSSSEVLRNTVARCCMQRQQGYE